MKRLVLFIVTAAALIFISVFCIGCSITNAQSDSVLSLLSPTAGPTYTPTATLTPTPTLTPCMMPTTLPQPNIFRVDYNSPMNSDTAVITIIGGNLVDNLSITGQTGEFVPITQSIDIRFEVPLVPNSTNTFTILQRINTITVENDCSHTVGYTWNTAQQIEIVHDSETDIELSVLQESATQRSCYAYKKITVADNVYQQECWWGQGHSDDITIERFADEAAAGAEFATRLVDSTPENFRCFPTLKTEWMHNLRTTTKFTWHVDRWLISIDSFHDTHFGQAAYMELSEKVYETGIANQMFEQCPTQSTPHHPNGAPSSVFLPHIQKPW